MLCIYIYTWVDNRHVSISHPNNRPTSGNNLIVFFEHVVARHLTRCNVAIGVMKNKTLKSVMPTMEEVGIPIFERHVVLVVSP